MYFQVSAIPTSSVRGGLQNIGRPRANFPPSVWKGLLIENASNPMTVDSAMGQQLIELKNQIRETLTDVTAKPSLKLGLIDDIQRSGVSYHFEKEIGDELQKISRYWDNTKHDDLHSVALRFRLLRQQGYHTPCDVFNKFKGCDGTFKSSLICDIPGMLSLYEASHLSICGEDILDEALSFTSFHLKCILPYLKDDLANQVAHALNRPILKGLPRLEAKYFLSSYDKGDSHNKTLLKFAKLDYNNLQSLHQKELSVILKWWAEIDCERRLPFVRDRVVECYFWVLGVYFEPQYSSARNITTKVLSIVSIIDDSYDAYGTLEELELFTEAIERWSPSCLKSLPEYMKLIYTVILDVYTEMEKTIKEERSFCMHYAKEEMKKLCQAYLVEAKWCNQFYVPTIEKYMDNGLVGSTSPLLITTSFIGMEIAEQEAFEWVSVETPSVRACSAIGRLMNDIVSHEFERERAHVASSVECYMEQHGTSKEQTVGILRQQVVDAWKDLNKEMLKPNVIHRELLTRILNLTRVSDVAYEDVDGYTTSYALKEHITSLIITPLRV